jgi:hypothetical protein
MKFTEKEIDMLQEMVDFPSAYKLTKTGVTTIKSILKKVETINKQK